MSARKNRPVMYEVARRPSSAVIEPIRRWMTGTQKTAAPATAAPPRPPEPTRASPHPPSASRPAPLATPPLRSAPPADAAAPLWRWTGERIELSIPWPVGAVVLAALLVIMLVIFEAGRSVGRAPRPTGDDTEFLTPGGDEALTPAEPQRDDRNTTGVSTPPRGAAPPEEKRPEPAPERKPGATQPPTADAALAKGMWYVCVQFFGESQRKAADDAAAFLQSKGIPCIVQRGPHDLRLIATQPFALGNKDAARPADEKRKCDELKRRIRDAGKEYRSAGGGYTFDGCEEKMYPF